MSGHSNHLKSSVRSFFWFDDASASVSCAAPFYKGHACCLSSRIHWVRASSVRANCWPGRFRAIIFLLLCLCCLVTLITFFSLSSARIVCLSCSTLLLSATRFFLDSDLRPLPDFFVPYRIVRGLRRRVHRGSSRGKPLYLQSVLAGEPALAGAESACFSSDDLSSSRPHLLSLRGSLARWKTLANAVPPSARRFARLARDRQTPKRSSRAAPDSLRRVLLSFRLSRRPRRMG